MNNKYKLVKSMKLKVGSTTLYRIKALRDFGNIKKGELGGYIENEKNLSHYGDCWVYGKAKVLDDARVFGDAQVLRKAQVYNNAKVFDNAKVFLNARVFGNARVYGKAQVYNNARVSGNAWVYGNAKVYGSAKVYGKAKVGGGVNISMGKVTSRFKCINITGLFYNITIVPGYVTIGCQTKSNEEWLKVTKKQAIEMELPAEQYSQIKTVVKKLMMEKNNDS